MTVHYTDPADKERVREETYDIPIGSRLFVEDGEEIDFGTKLAEWDPHYIPILAEKKGIARYEDIDLNVTMKEEIDPKTKVKRRVIIEHKGEKHPQIKIENIEGQVMALYTIPEKAYVEVEDGQRVLVGKVIAKTPREISGTQDITGGLPRVTEIFEARRPKNPSIISEIEGMVELGKKRRGKRTITVRGYDDKELREHLVPQNKHPRVHTGDRVKVGEPLVDGSLVPHDILQWCGEEELYQYLLQEVQNVYRSQNVTIDDKHIEIIISQMLRKVKVVDAGDTDLLPGAVIDKFRLYAINAQIKKKGGKAAQFDALLLGITKASLQSESFISAASFQETTKVLTEAALGGKTDELLGLKENVILGHMIPAGTGFKGYYQTGVKKHVPPGWGEEEEPCTKSVGAETEE